jgi:predicted O-methyltransferase YrrM
MPTPLEELKNELERYGATNDRATPERSRRMLNITRDTGEFLAVLVRATAARRILEVGTSNGYSTLWLAEAAQAISGTVTTLEASDFKVALARENFARAELAAVITQIPGDAGRTLRVLEEGSLDLIFLDSERSEYAGWWPDLRRALRPGGLLVVDNATSHPAEMAALVELVSSDGAFSTALVPVGNGEFLAVKTAAPAR